MKRVFKPEDIEVISFDVDGTLVEGEFNDLVWMEGIPLFYARKKGVPLEEARIVVQREYAAVGEGDLRWYDLEYWVRRWRLEISPEEIFFRYLHHIRLYPEVLPVLKRLSARFTLGVITQIPRNFLQHKIAPFEKYLNFTCSTITDFQRVKTKEVYTEVSRRLGITPPRLLHIGDHWDFDYVEARKAGVNALFLDRRGEREGGDIMRNLEELEVFLQNVQR